jgi:hypothetical protein
LYHVGYSPWHIPVGSTFDGAQTAVTKLRAEHDALIFKAKADPTERTRLRRAKYMRALGKEAEDSLEDDMHRADVFAGVIDDPQELINADFEETDINAEPI